LCSNTSVFPASYLALSRLGYSLYRRVRDRSLLAAQPGVKILQVKTWV
jgi:hypothetical protein